VTRDNVEAVPTQDPSKELKRCRNYVLWLLGRREWSLKELRTRLKQKGYPLDIATDCLDQLAQLGLQSDTRFALSRARFQASRKGNRQISYDLSNKGISPELQDEALGTLEPEIDRVFHAASRFEGKPLTPELRAKAWRFLASRGFSSSAIKAAVARLAEVELPPE
jgi:regulatory protein